MYLFLEVNVLLKRSSCKVNYLMCVFVGDTSTSQLRMRYLEQMVARLDREKKAMEEEFGRQRKKFMKEMVQAECE